MGFLVPAAGQLVSITSFKDRVDILQIATTEKDSGTLIAVMVLAMCLTMQYFTFLRE